jgi:hypothetical protein
VVRSTDRRRARAITYPIELGNVEGVLDAWICHLGSAGQRFSRCHFRERPLKLVPILTILHLRLECGSGIGAPSACSPEQMQPLSLTRHSHLYILALIPRSLWRASSCTILIRIDIRTYWRRTAGIRCWWPLLRCVRLRRRCAVRSCTGAGVHVIL